MYNLLPTRKSIAKLVGESYREKTHKDTIDVINTLYIWLYFGRIINMVLLNII